MIVAVDPGQNVGLAFRFDNGNWATITCHKVESADERLGMAMGVLLERLDAEPCNAIVVERFQTMGYMSKYGIETVELIGAVKAVAYLRGIPLLRQAPGAQLAFGKQATALLKERNQSYTDHEVSALSHLLLHEWTTSRGVPGGAAAAPNGTTPPVGLSKSVHKPATGRHRE